ncbi:MAG TPA: V-type ATP synthase subunit E [Bacillota bacterium]|jgi:V/A-type H+-transporting ATPase subunit E|nr:V-type ATP synthase subunit E [Bacillota bacterium]HOL09314.1 V-type ATP synthase subunit E [Bacillota bacterium]HPO97655.1 V-type ATP synthase subunit E [Bacillota bacterium]
MSDLQALTDSILSKAQNEAEEIIASAQKEADRIISEAKAKAEIRRGKIIDEYKKKAEELERRVKTEVEIESKKRRLETKYQLIEMVFTQVLAGLKKLPAEKRIKFLANKLAQAGMNGGGEVKGAGSPTEWNTIVKTANELIAKAGSKSKLTLSQEQPDFEGGFLLTGPGYVINGSFEALIAEIKEVSIPQIAEILFAEEKG